MIMEWICGVQLVQFMSFILVRKSRRELLISYFDLGQFLFPGRTNNEMLKLIMQTKGKISNKLLKKGEFSSRHFDIANNTFLSLELDPVTRTVTL